MKYKKYLIDYLPKVFYIFSNEMSQKIPVCVVNFALAEKIDFSPFIIFFGKVCNFFSPDFKAVCIDI